MGILKNSSVPETCPFCGGQIDIVITDEEGNIHDEEYAQNPYSGLGYEIEHNITDNPCCPIARHKGESLGAYIYDTKEELIEAWNKRA